MLVQPQAPEWYASRTASNCGSASAPTAARRRRRGASRLSTGERLGYDDLVLATGVRPRRLPGFDGEGVHYLRTAADAARLREELADGATG